jgi:precorrin-8X/cobalt-precorrin-8 methylmutase
LAPTKPGSFAGLSEWRTVEQVLRASGRRPFSSWQLLGAGAVGSQSLLGLPMLRRLGERSGRRVEVWPFTTGLRLPSVAPGAVVVAEVWPSMLPGRAAPGEVRDRFQVMETARWLCAARSDGRLAAWFAPGLPPGQDLDVVAEEGWVLGVEP